MRMSLQGFGLHLLNRVAQADWPDRLGLRNGLEKVLYHGSRQGFRAASSVAQRFKASPGARAQLRPGTRTDLFDLSWSDEQEQIRDSLARFAREILTPQAHLADSHSELPAAVVTASSELGLPAYAIPEAHGGMATENGQVTQALIAETLAQGDLSLAAALLTPIGAANAISRWGSGEQQATYLPAFLDEQQPLIASIAIVEPEPLFDPMRLRTLATRQGQDYRLNGHKSLVLRGAQADLLLIAAHTEQGPAVFIAESDSPGLKRREAPAMGLHACACTDLLIEDLRLPARQRLGDEDFDYHAFLDLSSLGWCALAQGCAQAVLDYVIPYCNERSAFGEPISHRQSVAFMIAQMAIDLDAMRLLTWRAASRAEQGLDFHREAYLARLFCNEKSMQIGTDGVQLLGGHGYTQEHPVERWYRDLRAIAVLHGAMHL